jgi:Fe-S-cluster-containing hydrogenase component 2
VKKLRVVDAHACTGCRVCELVCSFRRLEAFSPRMACIRVLKNEEEGIDTPIICRQCENAPCIEACPTRALARDDRTHAVVVSEEYCIGCGECVEACPFGAVVVDAETHKAWKCDLCAGDPECAKYCPTSAIQYVDSQEVHL